ncbi:Sensory transduction protein lytR [Acholeplasma hippikon]|uniref:Sensory transduction protein lytR n=2 Tax=Acholeplasma hippikon TaxID=264636 RepID=A0A449BI37_9MOLU|nr:Sensory transduction protein lytR [Acholeplasma hippikon]
MDSFDGLKTATKIREINQQAKIIFLTTSNDYVFDSFDVEPSSYLVKNKDEEKLQTVLDKIILKKSIKQNDNFNFTHKSVYYSISNDDILFFEINHRVVTLHTIEGKAYEFYSSFVELDQRVNKKRFVKIYRSYIVNMQYIKQLSIDEVELKTGIKLPVSKKCFNELRKTFANFLNTEE